MRRDYWRGLFGHFEICRHPEGDGGGGDDAVKKAAFERDSALAKAATLQTEIDKLKGSLPTDEDRKKWKALEDQQAQADEDRKKKAGEFETLKTELVKKHEIELAALKTTIGALEQGITDREINLAFNGAYVDKSPLFGDEKALTVLPPELAADALRRYVKVEIVDGKPVVKVVGPGGNVILDKKGDPAAFGPAMFEVINGLPTKDRILRGSGKTGSGSPGGGDNKAGEGIDFSHLTSAQMQDPKIRAQAKARTASAGGVVLGSAFDAVGQQ